MPVDREAGGRARMDGARGLCYDGDDMGGLWTRLNSRLGRRVGITLAVIIVLYTLLGFVGVPQALYYAADELGTRTGAEVKLEKARFNPYTLHLRLEGFELRFPSEPPLLAFDRLVVDFDGTSIFQGAYVFETLELVGAKSHIVREASGNINVQRIADAFASDEPPPPEPEEPSEPPSVVVRSLAIVDAFVRFRDEARKPAFETAALPITLRLQEFSTQPDSTSPFSFSAQTGDGAQIDWTGTIGVFPLASEGKLAITRLNATAYQSLWASAIRGRLRSGFVSVSSAYTLAQSGDRIDIRFDEGAVALDQVAFRDLRRPVGKNERKGRGPLSLQKARIQGVTFDLTKKLVSVRQARLTEGHVRAHRGSDGKLDLLALFEPPRRGRNKAVKTQTSTQAPSRAARRAPTQTSTRAPSKRAWRVRVREVALQDIDLDTQQATPEGPVRLRFDDLSINVAKFRLPELDPLPVRLQTGLVPNGRLTVTATIAVKPSFSTTARVDLRRLDLTLAEPLLAPFANVDLKSARLSVRGRVRFPARSGASVFRGRVALDDVATTDAKSDRKLAGFEQLDVSGVDVALDPFGLAIERVGLKGPYARVIIKRDRTTNLQAAFAVKGASKAPAAPKPKKKTKPKKAKAPPNIRIDRIEVADGSADFADLSIRPSFSTGIKRLKGTVTGLSSEDLKPGRVRLYGRVDGYSPVSITGRLRPFSPRASSQFGLQFKNVELTSFSSYSGKFLGYRLKKGKLSVELGYKIAGSKLDGENKVTIDRIELGDEVDSPDAVSVPLKLAIALLEDRDGRIELELPVSGDMDDPEFSFGGIIWSTFVNVLTKVALAPFDLIASMFGGGDELDTIGFAAGRARLDGEPLQKAQNVGKALAERERLRLEIEGRFDPQDDGAALARDQLDSVLAVLAASLAGKPQRARALAARLAIPAPNPESEADFALPGTEAPTTTPSPPPALAGRDKLIREAYRRVFEQPTDPSKPVRTSSGAVALAALVQVPFRGKTPDPKDPAALKPASMTASVADLEQELMGLLPPSEAALFDLARRRARAVQSAVLATPGLIQSERVFVLDVAPADDPMVHLNLRAE